MQAACALTAAPINGRRVVGAAVAADRPVAPPPSTSRRGLLSAAGAVLLAAGLPPAAGAVPLPLPPAVGDCPECIGEVNETLNACALDSASCTSTLSDDEQHFAAPWQFDGDRQAAIQRLVEVSSGGSYDPGLIDTFGGIRQADAAVFIARGVAAVVTGGDMPERPQRQRKASANRFDGVVVDRHTTPGGGEYLRVVLGAAGGGAADVDDPAQVIDAEFLFLADDNIINVRAASRVEPEGGLGSGGQLALSFREGLIVDRNVARRQLEALRTALGWDLAPIIADFSPAFNAEAPVFFEKVFNPFSRRNDFEPSGVSYPAEGGQ